jgi:hypothetical protein
MWGRLERLVRREGSRQERNLGTVAEIEVEKPGRAPENLPRMSPKRLRQLWEN